MLLHKSIMNSHERWFWVAGSVPGHLCWGKRLKSPPFKEATVVAAKADAKDKSKLAFSITTIEHGQLLVEAPGEFARSKWLAFGESCEREADTM